MKTKIQVAKTIKLNSQKALLVRQIYGALSLEELAKEIKKLFANLSIIELTGNITVTTEGEEEAN